MMKDFLFNLLMVMLTIIAFVTVLQIHHDKKNAQLCFDSKYETRKFKVNEETHKLYCKADNGYQELKRREQ